MATYNRAHLINDTLESIKNQTYQNFACLIIDDGSQDDTKIVVNEFINGDKRFSYYARPNKYKKGLPGCRNYGLDICKGNYVIFFDDDDIMHPQNLEFGISAIQDSGKFFCRFQRETFQSHFSIKLETQIMQPQSNIDRRHFYSIMTNRLPFNSCQIFWAKKCFEQFRFNEELMYAEEWECYLKIILTGFEGVNIENTLMYARKHPQSNTGEYFDGSAMRLNSHAEAIESLLHFIRKTNSWSFRVKKFLFNEYFRLKGHLIFVKLLNTLVGPLESRFWQTYARLIPFRMKLYQIRKSFKTTI
jgi:GalNAc5-diNAcBac-PP-undecaprenol beta-1,3-glucosyltransferase